MYAPNPSSISDPVIRVRGLPFSAREEDLISFFEGVNFKSGARAINFVYGRDGRANGEAYVILESISDVNKALAYHRKHLGKRYIEVFPSTFEELSFMTGRGVTTDDFVVRLRGLPYDVDKSEIMTFFDGVEIASNGIGLLLDNMGRSTGEAFVQFTSQEMLDKARAKHMQKIGHRYIEIFKSNTIEANNAIRRQMELNDGSLGEDMGQEDHHMASSGGMGAGGSRSHRGSYYGGRPGPYQRNLYPPASGRGGGSLKSVFGPGDHYADPVSQPGGGTGEDWNSSTGHSVHMRALPADVTDAHIYEFFSPLIPVHVEIHAHPMTGQLTGEADVDFGSHDEAKEAMKKDCERIGHNYIELILNSTPMSKMQREAAMKATTQHDVEGHSQALSGPPSGLRPPMPTHPVRHPNGARYPHDGMPPRRFPAPVPGRSGPRPAAPPPMRYPSGGSYSYPSYSYENNGNYGQGYESYESNYPAPDPYGGYYRQPYPRPMKSHAAYPRGPTPKGRYARGPY